MGWVVDRIVELAKAGREPSLFDLGVSIVGASKIGIDLLKDGKVDLAVVVLEGVMEHNLQVRVVSKVVLVVLWRGGAVQSNVGEGKCFRLIRLWGSEVELDGRQTWLEHPGFPVDTAKDLVDLLSGQVWDLVLNEELPGFTELDRGDACELVLGDVEVEEVLHLRATDEGLEIIEKLEALLVGDLAEGVVRVVTT